MHIIPVLCACAVFGGALGDDERCGMEASPNLIHHNPWLVFLEYYRRNAPYEIRCGGTLISKRYVITAAHCIKKKHVKMVARLGEYDVSSDKDCVGGVCADAPIHIEVENVIPHPDYDGKEHDIALLKLAEDAPYSEFIKPICLPSGEINEDVVFSAAGWGEIASRGIYSATKKILPLPFWPTDKCEEAYPNIDLPKHVICAGGEQGIDTCRGDSGGPLTWVRGKTELWGVTSSGDVNCGTQGKPGIYTSVMDHLDWIKAVMAE